MRERKARKENFSSTTPAAPEGYTNAIWQSDRLGNKSCHVPTTSGSVSDDAYDDDWNGVTDVAPSKNAIYDKLETFTVGNGNPYNLCVFPDVGDFSWVNQGGATTANTANGIMYIETAASVGNSLRLRVMNSPGAANSVTVAMHAKFVITGSTIWEEGIFLYDSGSGKAMFFGLIHWSGATPRNRITVLYFDSTTSSPSTQPIDDEFEWYAPLIWLRITDDGSSTRRFYVSTDGEIWEQVYSHARTTHFTSPDQLGVGINNFSGSITNVTTYASFEAT